MKKQLHTFVLSLFLFTISCCGQTIETNTSYEKATFGAGCFWCTEAIFEQLKGVRYVISGYTGGTVTNPTYEQICSGTTGHAEVVEVTFDPNLISFKELLEIFWEIHNPTTLNRQGADVGTQYRSVVFYHSQKQKEETEFYKKKLNEQKVYESPVVTEISAASTFYKAENYHQGYYDRNTNAPYCQAVITPKVVKFKKVFSEKLK
jgi:peptide-methionine (S)-S-oxide reductase